MGSSSGQYAVDSGLSAVLDGLRAQQTEAAEADDNCLSVNGSLSTPKRRPGRPPRNKDSMLAGLGSPPRPRINPIPTMNPREKLNLPKPSVRQIDPFKAHEESEGAKINYVDRTMANIGYQESEVFARIDNSLIRLPEGSIEEDLDLTLQTETEGPASAVAIGRVEYDMDEQDERWLDALNSQRKEEGVEHIKPAVFEVTITQIEKEWHALEKRKSFSISPASESLTYDQEFPNQIRSLHRRTARVQAVQLQLMARLQDMAKSKIRNVPYVTMVIVKILMRSCFVMGVIWPFIKNAMACHLYPRANGFVEDVNSLDAAPLLASCLYVVFFTLSTFLFY